MRLEPRAVVPGAAIGIAGIGVAVVVSRVTDTVGNDDRSFLILPVVELSLLGLFAGGWLAARRCRRAPLVQGAVAALAAVVACCVAAGVRRVAGDDGIPWATIAVWLLLALAAGTCGGLASLRPRHRADSPG